MREQHFAPTSSNVAALQCFCLRQLKSWLKQVRNYLFLNKLSLSSTKGDPMRSKLTVLRKVQVSSHRCALIHTYMLTCVDMTCVITFNGLKINISGQYIRNTLSCWINSNNKMLFATLMFQLVLAINGNSAFAFFYILRVDTQVWAMRI